MAEKRPPQLPQGHASPGEPQTRRLLALAAMGAVTFVWGLSFVSIKVAVEVLPPMILAFSRFVLASLILGVILWRREGGIRFGPRDRLAFVVSGVLGVTLYFFFENNGVKRISPSAAAIIVTAIPILSMLTDTIVSRTRMGVVKIVGVAASAFGVYLVVRHGLSEGGSSLAGYLFMFGAVPVWVIYNFLTRRLFTRRSRISIVAMQILYGTVAFIPFMVFEIPLIRWDLITPVVLLHVVFLGVFCSALAYTFYVYALNHLGVTATSLFLNLIPVVTVAFSALFLQDTIGPIQMLGGLLVIASVSAVSLWGR